MRKLILILAAIAVCAVLAGCAKPVPKYWTATSGSRSDAIVKLSFEYDPQMEIPEIDEGQGLEVARKRCNSWGYADVEAFGGVLRQCTMFGPIQFGSPTCRFMLVTKEFQCLGRGDATTPVDAQEKKGTVKKQ